METILDRIFPARTEALSAVRAAVREVCQRVCRVDKRAENFADECCEQLVLAINEACMNIVQHGYKFADGQTFTLQIAVDDDAFFANLLDNALAASDSDLRPRELDELRPGGLGVRFMRELMDSVTYLPAPPGFTNCLQLTKRIQG